MEYIGQTGRTLAKRFDEHRGYVRNKTKDPTGQHFNLMGHSISDMEVSVLEKVHSQSRAIREVRESYYIQEFQTELMGMNDKKWVIYSEYLLYNFMILSLVTQYLLF